MEKKRGPKKRPTSELKSKYIHVLVTKEMHKKITRNAKMKGFRYASEWIRTIIDENMES